jgi:hypothetical protein
VQGPAIVVKVGARVIKRVNVLKPSGHHQHYMGTTFEKNVIGAVTHHGRRPSDRSLHRPQSGEEMCGASVSRNGSVGPCCHRLPPFYMVRGNLGCNHELVAPPDHGIFVGKVTLFFFGMLYLKNDFSHLTFWVFCLSIFLFLFPRKNGLKDHCQHSLH